MEIVELTGEDLERFIRTMSALEYGDPVRKISVVVDGGFKFKINEFTWSPPLGQIKES